MQSINNQQNNYPIVKKRRVRKSLRKVPSQQLGDFQGVAVKVRFEHSFFVWWTVWRIVLPVREFSADFSFIMCTFCVVCAVLYNVFFVILHSKFL